MDHLDRWNKQLNYTELNFTEELLLIRLTHCPHLPAGNNVHNFFAFKNNERKKLYEIKKDFFYISNVDMLIVITL